MYSTSLKHPGVSHTLAPNVSLNPRLSSTQASIRLAHCSYYQEQPSPSFRLAELSDDSFITWLQLSKPSQIYLNPFQDACVSSLHLLLVVSLAVFSSLPALSVVIQSHQARSTLQCLNVCRLYTHTFRHFTTLQCLNV